MENDDVLVLCDLVEEYKLGMEKLQKELSYNRKELQRADENLSSSQALIAELEDSIYYLDDDINSKNDLLQRLVCLLDAESPADDIVAGLQLVLTAYEAGKDLDEVQVVSSEQNNEIRAVKALYEQRLSDRDEQLERCNEQIHALTRANQQLRSEREELLQRAEMSDKLLDESKTALTLSASAPSPDRQRHSQKQQAPDMPSPYRQLNSSVDSDDAKNRSFGTSSDSKSSPSSPVVPLVQRTRGAVVFQAVRSARARSILVAAAVPHTTTSSESEEKDCLDIAPSSSSSSSSSSLPPNGRYRTTETETSTLHARQHDRQRHHYHASDPSSPNNLPMKPTPLSFSHPKFKRDAVDECSSSTAAHGSGHRVIDDDDDDCLISPEDLRHSHRSYSVLLGSATSSPFRRSSR